MSSYIYIYAYIRLCNNSQLSINFIHKLFIVLYSQIETFIINIKIYILNYYLILLYSYMQHINIS